MFGISLNPMDLVNTGLGIANQRYNRRLNQKIFDRQDRAHQIAVKDLRAAGLSPTLAAGAPTQAGGSVGNTDAAQLEAIHRQMELEEKLGKSTVGMQDSARDLQDKQRGHYDALTEETKRQTAFNKRMEEHYTNQAKAQHVLTIAQAAAANAGANLYNSQAAHYDRQERAMSNAGRVAHDVVKSLNTIRERRRGDTVKGWSPPSNRDRKFYYGFPRN